MAEPIKGVKNDGIRPLLHPPIVTSPGGLEDLEVPKSDRPYTPSSQVQWSPTVDAHQPTHANLIVTLAVGAQAEEIVSLTGPHMEEYAQKCDAQFVVIRGKTQDWWGLEKFRVAGFAELHDRTLFVDADVFIRPTAPNIFDRVPPHHVGIFNETDNANKNPALKWRVMHFAENMYRDQGEPFPGLSCLNTGVVLCDRTTLVAWNPPPRPFTPMHTSEQVWIERNIIAHGLLVSPLASSWNCQFWWQNFGTRVPSAHFVHLAGAEHSLRVGFLNKLKKGQL